MARPDDKPVASVRPIQSTPIPMMPRQVGMGMAGSSSAGSLPVNFLQKGRRIKVFSCLPPPPPDVDQYYYKNKLVSWTGSD